MLFTPMLPRKAFTWGEFFHLVWIFFLSWECKIGLSLLFFPEQRKKQWQYVVERTNIHVIMSCFLFFFLKVNIKNKFALTATLARAERENMQERASVPCTLVHFLFSWSCASHEQLIRGVVYQKKKKKTVSRSLFWLKSFLKCFGPPSREATPRKLC